MRRLIFALLWLGLVLGMGACMHRQRVAVATPDVPEIILTTEPTRYCFEGLDGKPEDPTVVCKMLPPGSGVL